MAYERIVAVYDRAGKAEEALHALEASGFPSGDIGLLSRTSFTNAEIREASLWRRLFGRNVGEHESAVYGRTVEAGGAVLTLRLPETDVPRAMKILDVHSPIDVNERTAGVGMTASPVGKSGVTPPAAASTPVAKEEILRLAEEQLDVGKRQVETGWARIRRFVVEKPVESKVTLHEEHAEMVRRAVSHSAPLSEVDWTDKTIEITETAEQAVVTKTARVAEEIVIRREGSDHVETVRDTVRQQQVEFERVPKDVKKAA